MHGGVLLFGGVFAILAAVVIGALIHFIPSFIAFARRHPNRLAILLVNIFLGWTVIGWFGALVWSLLTPGSDRFDPVSVIGDLKSCPRCAERVKVGALVCRYCGYEFGPPPPPPPNARF